MVSIVNAFHEFQTVIQGYSPKVARGTWLELNKLVAFLEENSLTVDLVQLEHLEAYCKQRTTGKSLGYKNLIVSQIRAFFRFIQEQEYRVDNPSRGLSYTNLKAHQSLPEVASLQEIQACLAVLHQQATTQCLHKRFIPIRKRNLAMFALMYATGIRAGEAANLIVGDILWEEQVLLVRAGKGRKDRRVPVVGEALELLKDYLDTREQLTMADPLFLTWRKEAMDNNLIGTTFKTYSTLWGKALRPHQLRHTCATHLLEQSGNIVHIKQWLGHKRMDTTLHYARVRNPEIAQALSAHPINQFSVPDNPTSRFVGRSRKKLRSPLRRPYTQTPRSGPLEGKLVDQINEFLYAATSLNKYTDGTLKELRFSLKRFAIGCPACLELGVQALRGSDIIRWISSRRRAGISPRTIHKNLSLLRLFMSYALDRGWRADNPMEAIKLVPKQAPEQNYLSEEEVLRLLAAPDRSTVEGVSDYTMLLLLYSTGVRVGELCSLNVEDIDLTEGWVHVRKGKGRDRQVALPKAILDDLKKYVGLYLKSKTGAFLLNSKRTRLKPWTVAKRIRHYAAVAGLEKLVTPHTLRHTFTAHLIKRGGRIEVISKALGHRSLVETTPYVHSDFEDIRKAVGLLSKVIKSPEVKSDDQ